MTTQKKKPTHSTNIRSKVFGKAHKINKTSMGWPYEYFKISEKYFDITRLLHTISHVHNSLEKYSCIIIYELPYSSSYTSRMTKVWSPCFWCCWQIKNAMAENLERRRLLHFPNTQLMYFVLFYFPFLMTFIYFFSNF